MRERLVPHAPILVVLGVRPSPRAAARRQNLVGVHLAVPASLVPRDAPQLEVVVVSLSRYDPRPIHSAPPA